MAKPCGNAGGDVPRSHEVGEVGEVVATSHEVVPPNCQGRPRVCLTRLERKLNTRNEETSEVEIVETSDVNLSEIEEKGLILKVYSKVLKQHIWIVAREDQTKDVAPDPTYTVDECRRLVSFKITPKELKKIHLVKEIFSGTVVKDDEDNC